MHSSTGRSQHNPHCQAKVVFMAENDPRENTSEVKGANAGKRKRPTKRTLNVDVDGPIFEPDRWYHSKYMIRRLHCSPHTWERYKAAGLTTYKPGTRGELVWSTDLDAILRIPESELPPPYQSPHALKNKSRKRKGE